MTAPDAVQRVAQLARVDAEGERLAAAAVEDAGHAAGAAQAAVRARALDLARAWRSERVVALAMAASDGSEALRQRPAARPGTGRSRR